MKWNHLPVAGGIYDQSPKLLEDWLYIFALRAEKQAKDRAKAEAEAKNARNKRRLA